MPPFSRGRTDERGHYTQKKGEGQLTAGEVRLKPNTTYCRTGSSPRLNTRGVATATTAMILMRPGEGHLEACPMPSLNKRFTTYSLTPDRTAQRQAAD